MEYLYAIRRGDPCKKLGLCANCDDPRTQAEINADAACKYALDIWDRLSTSRVSMFVILKRNHSRNKGLKARITDFENFCDCLEKFLMSIFAQTSITPTNIKPNRSHDRLDQTGKKKRNKRINFQFHVQFNFLNSEKSRNNYFFPLQQKFATVPNLADF